MFLSIQSALLVSMARTATPDAPVRTARDAIRRPESASVLQAGEESSVTKVTDASWNDDDDDDDDDYDDNGGDDGGGGGGGDDDDDEMMVKMMMIMIRMIIIMILMMRNQTIMIMILIVILGMIMIWIIRFFFINEITILIRIAIKNFFIIMNRIIYNALVPQNMQGSLTGFYA